MIQRLVSEQTEYTHRRQTHWDSLAESPPGWGVYYHQRLIDVYRFLVKPELKVLELGCAHGDLLASLRPNVGVGVDLSPKMIDEARRRHPGVRFVRGDAHDLTEIKDKFDVIILSDLVNDLWDVQAVLEQLHRLSTPETRIILNCWSRLWQLPLTLAAKLGLSRPPASQNWLTAQDLTNLLNLANFEVMRSWQEVLCPLAVPGLGSLSNRVLVKTWPFRLFALTNFLVARPARRTDPLERELTVSVVVPARNEAGNIADILRSIPEMGAGTEIIFVEGNSKDDTFATIKREIQNHPDRACRLFKQTGVGKGDAVRLGFEKARGEILMILDADLTVPAEDLPRFYEAIRSGKGEFINGVRLIYPMQDGAMRFMNLLGNKFFSMAFSWLLGQPVKDTLCGTKVLSKASYMRITEGRSYFGDFDPFGDFDLIFGAAKLNLRLLDLPIRYRERTYGTTNIQRWRHGLLLLRMVLYGIFRMKFI